MLPLCGLWRFTYLICSNVLCLCCSSNVAEILFKFGRKLKKSHAEFCSLHIFAICKSNLNHLNVCHTVSCECALYLFSFTLCLIRLIWTCKDHFQILARTWPKLAHNWQFAYLHILFSEISVTWNAAITWVVMFYLLNMQQCTVPLLL